MLQSDRPEFDAQMRKLCAGANVPATEERLEAFWTGLAKMSLADFVRSTDHLLSLEDWKFPNRPGALWGTVRELKAQQRAVPQSPVEQRSQWSGDRWDAFANLRLMRHVTGQVGKRAGYCSEAMRSAYPVPTQPDQETAEIVHELVTAKDGWASDMREASSAGVLQPEDGDRWWAEYMEAAERAIAYVRARYQQKAAA